MTRNDTLVPRDSLPTLRFGQVSVRLRPRQLIVSALVLAAALVLGVLALGTGELPIPVPEVLRALVGQGDGLSGIVVTQWRLPRVVAALVFGAALGVSGAIFQSLTRNPLGSPDVIGFSTGAYTGALVVLLVLGGDQFGATLGALIGGLATALVVQLLAARHGSAGLRLVIVGIGISAMLSAVNHWLLLSAELEAAMAAAMFGAGTLNGLRWAQVAPAVLITGALLLVAVFAGRSLHLLELGDDTAAALGARPDRWRLWLVVLGVALVAAVTAVAGPVAFVALVAPQLARRLTGTPGADLLGAAALGALLLTGADLFALRAFAPTQVPVGVVTGCLGGAYLIWLLTREARRR
ncbi:iron ABC transporter permease [Enemella evansiae]|uniref:FecCD family ABC transporter permease n=1 Tax=Enemella evansiae TaxID=2016499 RepID=UPI000B963D9B|nr:iron chelate uptake ABC transporter family permease subunit [Enemella evansiae]OYO20448.1 iron ABC transporter permease [Enemella evansiae]